ncbi:hypothetical protein NQ318_016007, partial [Aromia moschata]
NINTYNVSVIQFPHVFYVAAETRIVNGTDAKEGEFPYAVSLRRNSSHTCGGTILNEKFILTAAHCVCDNAKPYDNSLFSIQYDMIEIEKAPTNTVNVKKINCHKFSSEKLIYDAAVLELEKSIPKGLWAPVKLSRKFVTDQTQKGTIIGWGRIHHGGPISKTLQKMEVEIYDDKTCGKNLTTNTTFALVPLLEEPVTFSVNNRAGRNQREWVGSRSRYGLEECLGSVGCAQQRSNYTKPCGDSGTALVVDGVQVGIASFITEACGTANKQHPNVYSRISTYYKWIAEVAGL